MGRLVHSGPAVSTYVAAVRTHSVAAVCHVESVVVAVLDACNDLPKPAKFPVSHLPAPARSAQHAAQLAPLVAQPLVLSASAHAVVAWGHHGGAVSAAIAPVTGSDAQTV